MKKKVLEKLDMITIFMKNDRVRKFVWLDTRSSEEDRYSKQIKRDKDLKKNMTGNYKEKNGLQKMKN